MHRLTPVDFAASTAGSAKTWYAHLVKLDASEIDLLAATGTGIAHCPQSNGRLGSGIAPVRELADGACRFRSAWMARLPTKPPT